jgi:hypothetical protein
MRAFLSSPVTLRQDSCTGGLTTSQKNLVREIHIAAMKQWALDIDFIKFSVHFLGPEPFCRSSGLKYEQNFVPTRLSLRALIRQMLFDKGTLTIQLCKVLAGLRNNVANFEQTSVNSIGIHVSTDSVVAYHSQPAEGGPAESTPSPGGPAGPPFGGTPWTPTAFVPAQT